MWTRRNRHERFATCEKPAKTRLGLDPQLPQCCWSCASRRSKSSPYAHKRVKQMHRSRLAELALLGQGPNRTEGWNLGGSLESPFRTDQALVMRRTNRCACMVETRWNSRSGPSGALCMGFDKLLYHSEMRGTGIEVRKKQIVWRDIHANRTQTLRITL